MSTLTSPPQRSTENLPSTMWQEREIQGIQIGQEEIKLSLLIDNMIAYIEDTCDLKELVSDLTPCTYLHLLVQDVRSTSKNYIYFKLTINNEKP